MISIILYQFQEDPFCLTILYDILFYFIHVYIAQGQGETTNVYIAQGQGETTLGDNIFYENRKV